MESKFGATGRLVASSLPWYDNLTMAVVGRVIWAATKRAVLVLVNLVLVNKSYFFLLETCFKYLTVSAPASGGFSLIT